MRPATVWAASAPMPSVAAPVRKRRRLVWYCSKTRCGVMSEERIVDSRLTDLRRSIAVFPSDGRTSVPNDMTPKAATGYSTPWEWQRIRDLARDLKRLGVRD